MKICRGYFTIVEVSAPDAARRNAKIFYKKFHINKQKLFSDNKWGSKCTHREPANTRNSRHFWRANNELSWAQVKTRQTLPLSLPDHYLVTSNLLYPFR